MNDHIVTSCADGTMTIELQRPEKKNALTQAMYRDVTDSLRLAERQKDIRCIVVTGNNQCFTSGNDIQDFATFTGTLLEHPAHDFLTALSTARKPLIAAVEGIAVGVGVTMLLHFDFVIVSENTLLEMPFITLGLIPEAASSLILPKMLGHQQAAKLLMLGDPIDAREALRLGLITSVCDHGRALAEAIALAKRITGLPPQAMNRCKQLMKRNAESVSDRIRIEFLYFEEQLRSAEAQEALNAVLEKRSPDFTKLS